MTTSETEVRTSKLLPAGIVLFILSFGASSLHRFASAMPEEALTRPFLYIAVDLLRLCFFVGITFMLLGWLRNRRWRKQAAAVSHPPAA